MVPTEMTRLLGRSTAWTGQWIPLRYSQRSFALRKGPGNPSSLKLDNDARVIWTGRLYLRLEKKTVRCVFVTCEAWVGEDDQGPFFESKGVIAFSLRWSKLISSHGKRLWTRENPWTRSQIIDSPMASSQFLVVPCSSRFDLIDEPISFPTILWHWMRFELDFARGK